MATKRVIAVVGQGFVGGSLSRGMQHTFDVYAYDKAGIMAQGVFNGARDQDGRDSLQTLVDRMENQETGPIGKRFTGIYFVCLPTPMYEDGEADLRIVEGTLSELADIPGERIAVVKSTVPPGSTMRWNEMYSSKGLTVIFNPEFLTEANALKDFMNQNRIILGGPRPQINKVKQVFQSAFPKVKLIKTSSTTAEMVKYVTNCFLATKVSFANEMSQVCEALDAEGLNIDYDKVMEYAQYDNRLGTSHWAVPGPVPTHDGRYVRGFGGHCFPKDLQALKFVANALGIDVSVLDGVWAKNLEVRGPEDRDWELMKNRAVSKRDE
jgi:UDPglucose 6-dehydrogenase